LRRLGQECHDVIGNDVQLQLQWCRENRPDLARAYETDARYSESARWLNAVLTAQVELLKPDVLYVHDLNWFDPAWIAAVKEGTRLLVVGQTACELRPDLDCSVYDLILTSLPHYVAMFRAWGVNAELLPFAFESTVLDRIGAQPRQYGVVFAGTYAATGQHAPGTALLEHVVPQVFAECWGTGVESLARMSPIRRAYRGEAWGLDMYRVYARSRVVLNRHAPIAYRYAANMRMYEATGMGAMLLTDAKDNLNDLFNVGTEVVAYGDAEECATLARYYLEHEDERETIACAGQARTLRDHTYIHRMETVLQLVRREAGQHSVAGRPAHDAQVEGTGVVPLESGAYRRTRRWFLPRYSRARRALGRGRRMAGRVKNGLQRTLGYGRQLCGKYRSGDVTGGYKPCGVDEIDRMLVNRWQSAATHWRLINQDLTRMYRGKVAPRFWVAAQALRATHSPTGNLVELGSESGYHTEVFRHLVTPDLKYVGVDNSVAMLALGHHHYPDTSFVRADPSQLCYRDNAFDIVFASGAMSHVAHYEDVVREAARVARQWCIFHCILVSAQSETTSFAKFAHGTRSAEFLVSERELLCLFHRYGLFVRAEFVIDQTSGNGRSSRAKTKTYVCRKVGDCWHPGSVT
jgi:spore maturation protein CgeB